MRLYPRLAFDGMRKNARLYIPYLLTCGGMVMMFYLLDYLAYSRSESLLPFMGTAVTVLKMGCGVISVFAVLFLFYTNSFLMRRRKKEFGLYHVLGMGKRDLGRILFWESLFTAGAALLGGLAAGVALSKMAELFFINLMGGTVDYDLSLPPQAVWETLQIFGAIFLLLFLKTVLQVRSAGALDLLKSEAEGEKPPRANWLLGIAGVVILGAAYYIALSIKDAMAAITWFFLAALLVIVATYLLLTFGSVLLCRILQKNKRYYYRANHFISVSSMAYRMKRNGAGLASVCVLATMVLVMISSTACLYSSVEAALRDRYPREINVELAMQDVNGLDPERLAALRAEFSDASKEQGVEPEDVYELSCMTQAGYVADENGALTVYTGRDFMENPDPMAAHIYQFQLVPLADYNRIMEEEEQLADGEVLLYINRGSLEADAVSFEGGPSFSVKKVLDRCFSTSNAAMTVLPTITLVVSDLEAAAEKLAELEEPLWYNWTYAFDTGLDRGSQADFCTRFREALRDLWDDEGQWSAEHGVRGMVIESREAERQGFLGLYGGLFYLGIMLSIVFLFAAVLILYYKQISEGYEDQARFEIMQKVGMTRREIRKSINSQILTVFFLPLLLAGVHMCFAFPAVWKMMQAFNIVHVRQFAVATAVSFGAFALFYVIVYRITSNAYYNIVSGARERT